MKQISLVMEFVLTGFRQDANVRRFAFQRVAGDHSRTEFTVSADMSQTSSVLTMGNGPVPAYTFNGKIGEVLVYNRALSDTERQSIEAALTAKYAGSVDGVHRDVAGDSIRCV